MSKTPALNIYESTFASSDKTDAILVVDGKKLHVNKGLLSYHSDYFRALFNSDFAEKSMPEIPIKDVKFEEFATLLSTVQDKPITLIMNPSSCVIEQLLQLADRFLMTAAKQHLELFIGYSNMARMEKLRLADKYNMEGLLTNTVETFNKKEDYKDMHSLTKDFNDHTRSMLFQQFFLLCSYKPDFDMVLFKDIDE